MKRGCNTCRFRYEYDEPDYEYDDQCDECSQLDEWLPHIVCETCRYQNDYDMCEDCEFKDQYKELKKKEISKDVIKIKL